MVGVVIVLALLLVHQFYLYQKVQRLFGLVLTFALPLMDAAYPGLPFADEEVFNDKEMAELTSATYLDVFSRLGLADKVDALAQGRKNVWRAQKALRKELEAKIPRS